MFLSRLKMHWHKASILALLPTYVLPHSEHYGEHQEPLSEERLEELEQKWGTDVGIDIFFCFETY